VCLLFKKEIAYLVFVDVEEENEKAGDENE
jgi:hypothetical protein